MAKKAKTPYPKDRNKLAKFIADIATGEVESVEVHPKIKTGTTTKDKNKAR